MDERYRTGNKTWSVDLNCMCFWKFPQDCNGLHIFRCHLIMIQLWCFIMTNCIEMVAFTNVLVKLII